MPADARLQESAAPIVGGDGSSFKSLAMITAILAGILAVGGLLGYIPGWRALGSLRSDYIPMAPTTAGCFLILALTLLRAARKTWRGAGLVATLGLNLLVLLQGLAETAKYFTKFDLTLDEVLAPAAASLGEIPVGQMAPITGVAFVVAAAGTILLLASRRDHRQRSGMHWVCSLGVLTSLVAATMVITYLYGTPLGYGGKTVPMALTTAIAFLMLGTGLVAAAGPESFPLRVVIGDSTAARLSRVFLPLSVLSILLHSILSRLNVLSFVGHEAVTSAVLAILAGAVTAAVAARMAHSIGGRFDANYRALRWSEARNRALLQAIPDFILSSRRDGELLTVHSPDSASRLPMDQSSVHRRIGDVLPQPVADKLMSAFAEAIDSDEVREVQFSLASESGEAHFEARVVATAEETVLSIIRDISERQQAELSRAALELQLRESQKMEAIGTLAGGIAHDFNNILAIVLGHAELARETMNKSPLAIESLDAITTASIRARDLVKQILSFSRRQPTALKVVALEPIVEESVRLLRATLPARMILQFRCAPDLPPVLADANQIQQIVINLATNAMQALADAHGRIEISLDAIEPGDSSCPQGSAIDDPLVRNERRKLRLTVSDDGPGMEAPILARIFEPFFTTKGVGAGTGLGLSVVHGILRAHAGEIAVESAPGEGSRFSLLFPGVDGEIETPEPSSAKATAEPTPGERAFRRILYLDDEPALAHLIRRQLEGRGYRVHSHTRQTAALAALAAEPDGFDLVITDCNMPGMSGLDVARTVRELRADLPVIMVSGYVDETLRAQAATAGVRELILKASGVGELCAALDRLARPLSQVEAASTRRLSDAGESHADAPERSDPRAPEDPD